MSLRGKLLLVCALLASSLLVAAPAAADTPTCVSQSEYNQILGTHWTMARVHGVFDRVGSEVGQRAYYSNVAEMVRVYQRCNGDRYWLYFRKHKYWNSGGNYVWTPRWRFHRPVCRVEGCSF